MTPSCVALGRVIICDLNFKRTENHNFTITTNMSQHVEFFHSLIFCLIFVKLPESPCLTIIFCVTSLSNTVLLEGNIVQGYTRRQMHTTSYK